MYRGYQITVSKELHDILEKPFTPKQPQTRAQSLLRDLNELNEINKRSSIKPKLLEMIRASSLQESDINAASIWDEWFPEIQSNVFISHSSKDKKTARALSSWLDRNLGLSAFIDSDIWGHADDLLKEIDNKYCMNSDGTTYSYQNRNASTAHVHMILSYALTRMIDKTECFIFLSSDNSVTVNDSIQGTLSPWIFHELATVDSIQVRSPEREMRLHKAEAIFRESLESYELKIKYPIMGNRLTEISHNTITKWARSSQSNGVSSLDALYSITSKS